MKKLTTLLLLLFICAAGSFAQSRGDELMKQAKSALDAKEYVKARYNYLQSYNAFASAKNYPQAAEAGVNVAKLYHRENYYKEAFDILNKVDMIVAQGEAETGKTMPELHYKTANERMNMYVKLKNPVRAKDCLNRMEEYAKSAGGKLAGDLLYSQANYYYTFGQNSLGDAAINKLIETYQKEKDYEKADECYRQLIATATRTNNARLVARTYERYNSWTDSIRAITAKDELQAMKAKYDDSLKTIEEKDHSLAVKTGIIVTLGILLCVLAAALVVGFIILMRYIALNRKLKKNIMIANEHNTLKTEFIRNISAQMEPTLATLDQRLPAVQALRNFSSHIQELSDLESSLSEHYEMQDNNVLAFCEKVADDAKGLMKPGATLSVNAPKMSAKFNPEEVEAVLVHLLVNASLNTPADGKITLEFKKRGAHTLQFIVTDTGCGISEEYRDKLFKPFAEVRDLTQGDALGLPICSLKASKMNGSLTLDGDYTHGARFILEVHDK